MWPWELHLSQRARYSIFHRGRTDQPEHYCWAASKCNINPTQDLHPPRCSPGTAPQTDNKRYSRFLHQRGSHIAASNVPQYVQSVGGIHECSDSPQTLQHSENVWSYRTAMKQRGLLTSISSSEYRNFNMPSSDLYGEAKHISSRLCIHVLLF